MKTKNIFIVLALLVTGCADAKLDDPPVTCAAASNCVSCSAGNAASFAPPVLFVNGIAQSAFGDVVVLPAGQPVDLGAGGYGGLICSPTDISLAHWILPSGIHVPENCVTLPALTAGTHKLHWLEPLGCSSEPYSFEVIVLAQ